MAEPRSGGAWWVFDENGTPLVGAVVYYNTGGGFMGRASGNDSAVTDAEGRFVTRGEPDRARYMYPYNGPADW